MKIALVCPYDIAQFGGVQNQVMEFAKRAKYAGHDVTIIAPSSKKENTNGIVRIGRPLPVPVGRGTVAKMTFSFWRLGKLKKLLADGCFDVVHVHEPSVPLIGPKAVKYSNLESTVLLTTSHTNITPNVVTWSYGSFGRLLGWDNLMDKVQVRTAVSPAAANRANHYLPGSYVIIPNGIDTERFSPKVKPLEKYLDGRINILFVGRLGDNERRKGLYYVVSAFNHLHWQYKNTRLLIVGPGQPDKDTREIISETDNNGIVLAGPASADELPRYYSTAHIFAATPTDGESFSLVVAEAMASAKPVVTSNIPGPRDVLLGYSRYGKDITESEFHVAGAGILVPPRDIPMTAKALERLVNDESERVRMGAAGREIVVAKFS